jgi:hypothetical protein
MAQLDPQKKPDLFLIRGDSYSIPVSFSGINLTGSTVFFTIKPALTNDADDTTAVLAIEVTSHDDPTNGHTIIPLTSTDTEIEPGEYYYDIQIKNGATVTSIPARKVKIVADVTRRLT